MRTILSLWLVLLLLVSQWYVGVRPSYSTQSFPSGKGGEQGAVHIVAFGDSLTAGYGLENAQSYPFVLERVLRQRGFDVRVTNAGVSGDTSAGGAARIAWTLADAPDVLILELGANDALQGLDPALMRENLAAILRACKAQGVRVLLAGMRAPRNMGADYAARFDAVYPGLASEFEIPIYPFFLEGVAVNATLNQHDGMHPNALGVERIVNSIVPYVTQLLVLP